MIDTSKMSRRLFLGGALALAATPVIARTLSFIPAPPPPKIVADGVFDDWAGLQALVRGEPFEVEAEDLIAIEGLLGRGLFRVSQPLVLERADFAFQSCTFIRKHGDEGVGGGQRMKPLFSLQGRDITVRNTQLVLLNAHGVLQSEFVIDKWETENGVTTSRRRGSPI